MEVGSGGEEGGIRDIVVHKMMMMMMMMMMIVMVGSTVRTVMLLGHPETELERLASVTCKD